MHLPTDRETLRQRNSLIAQLRAQLRASREDAFPADCVIWIFGSARTGSTWLGRMLGEFGALWDEPAVGALFGEFYFERFPERRGRRFVMADRYRDAWLPPIRDMVLRGAAARYDGDGFVTIKEPHGSVGAPLLVEALPESRVVLLVRDPRDAIASDYEAESPGGWWASRRTPEFVTSDRYDFWTVRSRRYLWDFERASEAYQRTSSPKAIVRYEDLRADTVAEIQRVRDALLLPVDNSVIHAAIQKHAWEHLETPKGPGRFYRKAVPGAWREELSAQQVEKIEREAGPILRAFYDGKVEPLRSVQDPMPARRARELNERLRLREP